MLPPTEAFTRTRRYARDALTLDPRLADVHYLLGELAFWHEWDADECEQHIGRALALEPNSAETLMLSARLHMVRGRHAEMLHTLEAAVHADPVGLGTHWYVMVTLYCAGAFDRTITEANRMLARDAEYVDAFRWRGKARCMMGDAVGGLEDLQQAAAAAPPHAWLLAELAIALSANHRLDDANRIRDDLVERSEREWIPPTAIALAQRAMGDVEAALRWCVRAYETRDFLCVMLPIDGMFRLVLPGETTALVDDPRWIDLVKRVGMT